MFQSILKSQPNEDISILVQLDNHPWNYICECGDASSWTVKEVQNANAIFISHTHIDHFVNFDMVIRHQIGIQRKVIICGPKDIAKQVQAKLKSYTWNLIKQGAILYEIHEMVADHEIKVFELEPPTWTLIEKPSIVNNIIFQDKHFKVSAILLDHKTPTLAYKFEENDTIKIDIQASGFRGGRWVKLLKEAFEKGDAKQIIPIEDKEYSAKDLFHLLHLQKGDTVGVIMDHAANSANHQKITAHFFGCNKVFIESFYKNEDRAFAELNYHSYAAMSGKVMRDAQVKQPVPVHFSRKYSLEEIQELINEFEMVLKEN